MDFIEYALLGNYHASELCFVWDNQWPPILHDFSPNDQQIADIFGLYWSNLGRFQTYVLRGWAEERGSILSGETRRALWFPLRRPNDAVVDLFWPPYNATYDTNLNISLPLSLSTGLRNTACDFWDAVMHNISTRA